MRISMEKQGNNFYKENFELENSMDFYDNEKNEEIDFTLDEEKIREQINEVHGSRQKLLSFEEALMQYKQLCSVVKVSGDYAASRERFRELSFELNVHGLLAPGFRDPLKVGKGWNDPIYKVIDRDLVVIDCHWFYCQFESIFLNDRDEEFQGIFCLDQNFDFDLADEFSLKKWKKNNRVLESLRLTDFQQIQTAALRSKEIKEKFENLNKAPMVNGSLTPSLKSEFEKKLSAWIGDSKSKKEHRPTYRILWQLHKVIGDQLNGRQLSELTAMALGQPKKDPKTVKTQLQTVLRKVNG